MMLKRKKMMELRKIMMLGLKKMMLEQFSPNSIGQKPTKIDFLFFESY